MVADYKVCLSYQNKTNQPKIIQKQNKTKQTWGQTAKFAYTLKKKKVILRKITFFFQVVFFYFELQSELCTIISELITWLLF